MRTLSVLTAFVLCSTTFCVFGQSVDETTWKLVEREQKQVQLGHLDEALVTCGEAIKINPEYSPLYILRSLVHKRKGDYENALIDLDKAVGLDPSAYALCARAALRMKRNEDELALKDLKDWLEISPGDSDPIAMRAFIWNKHGEYDKAILGYTEAINIDPKNCKYYYNRACCWLEKKDYEKAMSDCNQVIWIDIKSTSAYNVRGSLYWNAGKYEQTINDYATAIEIDANYFPSHLNYAKVLFSCSDQQFRDGEKAIVLATRACELSEWKSPEAVWALAASYAETGNYSKAVEWQTKSVELAKGPIDSWEAKRMLDLFKEKKPCRFEPDLKKPDLVFPDSDDQAKPTPSDAARER